MTPGAEREDGKREEGRIADEDVVRALPAESGRHAIMPRRGADHAAPGREFPLGQVEAMAGPDDAERYVEREDLVRPAAA